MTFTATLKIQGVSVFKTGGDGRNLTVLFPDQERAQQRYLAGLEEGLCAHRSVIQYWGEDAEAGAPDVWQTHEISGMRVTVESDSSEGPSFADDGLIRGVPSLARLLSKIDVSSELHADALPDSESFDHRLLSAAMVVENQGVLGMDARFKGQYEFFSRDELDRMRTEESGERVRRGRAWRRANLLDAGEDRFSSVLQLELGPVSKLALVLRPLDSGQTGEEHRLEFKPRFDHVEIWVRNFCHLAPPAPGQDQAEPGDPDNDYLLNYSLLRDYEALTVQQIRSLPIPVVAASWEGGEPIGGKPNNCAGAGGG